MPRTKYLLFYFNSKSYRLRNLTISMVLWLILYPILEGDAIRLFILNILMSAIVLFGIFAVSYGKKTVVTGLAFGLPWFILTWLSLFISSTPLILILLSNVFLIFFLSFTAIVILLFVIRSKEISADFLYGAVSVYLLIGGTWSTIYTFLEAVQPGSFVIDSTYNIDGIVNWSDLLYYSYATLTTLGYGDVIPVTSHARSLAVIEAIIGVMYLATIISRLVGLFISKSLNNKDTYLEKEAKISEPPKSDNSTSLCGRPKT